MHVGALATVSSHRQRLWPAWLALCCIIGSCRLPELCSHCVLSFLAVLSVMPHFDIISPVRPTPRPFQSMLNQPDWDYARNQRSNNFLFQTTAHPFHDRLHGRERRRGNASRHLARTTGADTRRALVHHGGRCCGRGGADTGRSQWAFGEDQSSADNNNSYVQSWWR